jgi:general secretion pathway protein G
MKFLEMMPESCSTAESCAEDVIAGVSAAGTLSNARGMTLLEVMITVVFIAILTALSIPAYTEYKGKAKISRAKSEIRSLEIAINSYYAEKGSWPADLTNIGFGLNTLKDPWGHPYQYQRPAGLTGALHFVAGDNGVNSDNDFDLWSKGEFDSAGTSLSTNDDLIVRARDGGFVGLASEYGAL